MTNETYEKAKKIKEQIEDLRTLYRIASMPYKKFSLVKKTLCISEYDRANVVLCDEELIKVIQEYCDKRLKELEEELNAL